MAGLRRPASGAVGRGTAGVRGALLLVGLVTRAAAGPVDRRLTQLGDAVDLALGRRMSWYARRYREHVRTSHRFVDSKGLATVGAHTPELDKVFVDVGLAPRPPHQVSGGVLADAPVDVAARHSIHEFLDQPGSRCWSGGPPEKAPREALILARL